MEAARIANTERTEWRTTTIKLQIVLAIVVVGVVVVAAAGRLLQCLRFRWDGVRLFSFSFSHFECLIDFNQK